MLSTDDIRKKFLDFFADKGHTIIPSDSLVPKDDPTVLFTTAGMQQFKRQFLGQTDHYTRAASSQKCLRTDDLDKIGKTAYHHTFFEMLGNFSFGDYFKKEAIQWGWEFLTQELKIPADKLWASVYTDDKEAETIWLKTIKLDSQKVVRLDDRSNFWPAEAKTKGPNGPCGPCSEIFYDYGVNPQCPKKNRCDPSCDCGRFSEVWNLVFTQYNRKEDGTLAPLPNKNIDTGMGLERLAAVVQNKKSNFEIDLFTPIFKAIDQSLKETGCTVSQTEKNIIADHIRAICFGITDGVVPSNEGRGYVIKKLIIDVTDIVLRQGAKGSFIHKVVPAVVSAMGKAYPELKKKKEGISGIVKNIEHAYLKVRKTRVPEFAAKLKTARGKGKVFDQSDVAEQIGELFFLYRDTYGLPLETIIATAKKNLSKQEHKTVLLQALDIFSNKMDKQKKQSRASSKMTGDVFTDTQLDLNVPKTKFLGYDRFEAEGKVLKLFVNDKPVDTAKPGDVVKVILDQTPFYAESGGQVGDTGVITINQTKVRVTDTQKIADVFIHSGSVKSGSLAAGSKVKTSVDRKRRLAIMRNHTATHLLQSALREVLGTHVQQQGSLVAEDRLRFDFTHPQAIKKDELKKIEGVINTHVLNCDAVTKKVMSLAEAKKSGALAFFAEKYGQTVRVVAINGYSKEFCGGTHLESTGQIGLFKITAESAIAQGIRRLEAITGTAALQFIDTLEHNIQKTAQALKAPVDEIAVRAERQAKALKELERKLEALNFEKIKDSVAAICKNATTTKGIKIIHHYFDEIEAGHLRKIADLIKQKEKSSVIVLGSQFAGSANLLVVVTDSLVKKGIKANELITELAALINGKGGGRPPMAQAGSKETGKIEGAIKKAASIVKKGI